jgi:hypothetical protein
MLVILIVEQRKERGWNDLQIHNFQRKIRENRSTADIYTHTHTGSMNISSLRKESKLDIGEVGKLHE